MWRVQPETTFTSERTSPYRACSLLRIAASTTIESLIATPTRPIVPTIDIKPNGNPNTESASGPRPIDNPPTAATIIAQRKEPKDATSVSTISANRTIAFPIRLFTELDRCSVSPPNSSSYPAGKTKSSSAKRCLNSSKTVEGKTPA